MHVYTTPFYSKIVRLINLGVMRMLSVFNEVYLTNSATAMFEFKFIQCRSLLNRPHHSYSNCDRHDAQTDTDCYSFHLFNFPHFKFCLLIA
jgi:hypothetical protein